MLWEISPFHYDLDVKMFVFNINAKRFKPNGLNPSKFHEDGLLDSFDHESFEVCESCLLKKMTNTPSVPLIVKSFSKICLCFYKTMSNL